MHSTLNKKERGEKEMYSVIDNKFSMILGAKRLKITDVAKNTGISRTTLTNLYYDRNAAISLDTLDRLCGFLQCGIGDLFEYKKED
nr:MAG TPA: Cro/C1-type HTH DNA-binding domain protein [Caudoviricetes sp.]